MANGDTSKYDVFATACVCELNPFDLQLQLPWAGFCSDLTPLSFLYGSHEALQSQRSHRDLVVRLGRLAADQTRFHPLHLSAGAGRELDCCGGLLRQLGYNLRCSGDRMTRSTYFVFSAL